MIERSAMLPVRSRLERRRVVLVSAIALMAAIFALRQAATQAPDSITLLYVIPVALVALELGAWAGIAAAAASLLLIGVWLITREPSLGALAFAVRAVILTCIGAIPGHFSDRMRGARRRETQLLKSGLALAELSDRSTLAHLIARRATNLVPTSGVRIAIEDAQAETLGTIRRQPLQIPLVARGTYCGLLELEHPRRRTFNADERVAIELLAVQAAVAAENQRLLAAARRQAADQERERSNLAHGLHEEVTQALAAIQLGLGRVERDVDSPPTRAQLESLRAELADTLVALRELAVALRPPALDQLGLEPALRGLVRRTCERTGHVITLEMAVEERLPADLETAVYRVLDDLIGALSGPASIRVVHDRGRESLRIEVTGSPEQIFSSDLRARISARLELTSGTLNLPTTEQAVLRATIPLPTHARAE